MRTILTVACIGVLFLSTAVVAKTVDEYIAEAGALREGGNATAASELLKEAAEAYPEDALVQANLGLVTGALAGEAADAGNFPEAGNLLTDAFVYLDKGVELDPDNPTARFYRGMMGVNIPAVFGKLNQSLDDLKYLVGLHEKNPDAVSMDMLVQAYQFMAVGYTNIGERPQALAAWEKVVELAPDGESAGAAEESIAKLKADMAADETAGAATADLSPEEVDEMIAKGKALIEAGKFAEAEDLLNQVVASAPDNAEAHRQLAIAIMSPFDGGDIYDQEIHEDTDRATNAVFRAMTHLDKAVELAPDDMKMRLLNGVTAVSFPFFVGKLDQGIEYLQMVMDSDLPSADRAEAAFWLGYAYQKKGMSQWIGVVNKYPEAEASAMVLNAMRPHVERFDPDAQARPVVGIEFLIAFRDELPPQTAVWIETPDEEFVRTLYVSGFSGHVKEAQVVLPVWASATEFAGADAVTGASIDTGQHAYVWDLKDMNGKPVKKGKYVVKVEVHHWPSMKYQMVEGEIEIGDKAARVIVQEGDFLPYLKLTYLP
jgi:tetratricopeptide (TPR) repeat protein